MCFFSESFFVFLIMFIRHSLNVDKNYENILLFLLHFKKETLVCDLCTLYELSKLYELCRLYVNSLSFVFK